LSFDFRDLSKGAIVKILHDLKRALIIVALAFAFALVQLSLCGFAPPAKVPFGVEADDIEKLSRPIGWIDARPTESFNAGHIPSALNLNQTNWDEALPKVFETFQPGNTIVVYCSPDCSESEEIASRIRNLGFNQVFVLEGGFEAWQTHYHGQ
jgi:rhodanese-related sulfurtransferase